jgi:hypothetical protein
MAESVAGSAGTDGMGGLEREGLWDHGWSEHLPVSRVIETGTIDLQGTERCVTVRYY